MARAAVSRGTVEPGTALVVCRVTGIIVRPLVVGDARVAAFQGAAALTGRLAALAAVINVVVIAGWTPIDASVVEGVEPLDARDAAVFQRSRTGLAVLVALATPSVGHLVCTTGTRTETGGSREHVRSFACRTRRGGAVAFGTVHVARCALASRIVRVSSVGTLLPAGAPGQMPAELARDAVVAQRAVAPFALQAARLAREGVVIPVLAVGTLVYASRFPGFVFALRRALADTILSSRKSLRIPRNEGCV